MMTTYKRVGDYLELEIYGQISGDEYVAVGFSADDKMVRYFTACSEATKLALLIVF